MENNIGSHNSMTYLKPLKWYMKPFLFIARCQEKSIKEQHEVYGVNVFDIRVGFKGYIPYFKHGLVYYEGNVYETLNYIESISSKEYPIYVRVIYDDTFDKKREYNSEIFKEFCEYIDKNYTFKCFEGCRKSDKKNLYSFRNWIWMNERYASVCNKKYSLYPKLYAKKYNRKFYKKGAEGTYCLITDFVNIR